MILLLNFTASLKSNHHIIMYIPPNIKALLFDLGGVIIRIDWNKIFDQWAERCPFTSDEIHNRFSMDSAYKQHERGELSAADYFAYLKSKLGYEGDDQAFIDGWNAIFVGEVGETVTLLNHLKTKIPLYLLTNSNPTHELFWRNTYSGTIELFTDVFVSSSLGHRKPDRSVFEAIAEKTGIELSSILFFDDTLENVEGARAAGVHSVLVTQPADILRALSPQHPISKQ